MIDLKGKNIIVTGASCWIGNSIIEKLNQAGANILASGTRVEKLDELKNLLIKQIENRVRWRESVINMIENDVNHFIEIGPGKVLSGLVKRINRNVKIDTINSQGDIEGLKIWLI